MACKKPHTNTKNLKTSVTKAWNQLSKAYIIRTCKGLRHGIKAVMEA